MRSFLIICVFFVFVKTSSAQTKAIDSLLSLLPKLSLRQDSSLLNVYTQLVKEYYKVDNEKALDYAAKAIPLAKQNRNAPLLALVHYRAAMVEYANRNYELAMQHFKNADSIYTKHKMLKQLGEVKLKAGRTVNAMGEYKRSNQILTEALALFVKTNQDTNKAKTKVSMGANYYNLSDYVNANKNYLEALTIYEGLKDTSSIIPCLSTLGLIKNQQYKYEDAIHYYNKTIALCKATKNEVMQSRTYTSLGNTYDNLNDTANAFKHYRLALAIQQRLKDTVNMANTYTNIGFVASDTKQYDIAFPNLQKGYELLLLVKDFRNAAVCNSKLGICILNAPDSVLKKYGIPQTRRYAIAESKIKSSIKGLQELEDIHSEFFAWQALATVYNSQGRYQLAYEAMAKADTLKDAVLSSDKNDELLKQQMDYEFDKETAVAAALHKDALSREKTRRNYALAGVVFLALCGLTVIYFNNRKKEAVEQRKNAELSNKVLRLQMNPHFIFNSLNSISDFIRKNNSDAADDYLTKFSKAMRMTLEHSEEKLISLEDEIAFLELYLQLERRRMNSKFAYTIKVDESINMEETLIPPLMLQPFVENSIWHGMAKKEGDGHIDIFISEKNGMLQCNIEDDGTGLKLQTESRVSSKVKKTSLAVKITQARIDLLNKNFKTNASLAVLNKPDQGGVSVTISLPNNLH